MNSAVAIQPDSVRHGNGELQSFSARWIELAGQAGIEVRIVDVYAPDFLEQLAGCNGFMWRFGYSARERLFAKRLIPALEQGEGMLVFPSWKTAWHFEDKLAQFYLLRLAGIPMPPTWIFWQRQAAAEFCRKASYPLVMKLAHGIQSKNVRLLRNAREAAHRVDQMFGPGVTSLDRATLRRLDTATRMVLAKPPRGGSLWNELEQGYIFLQEFVPGNEFDTRVTVIGDRAFAFRRFNRPGDFRASGSGRIDWDPAAIDPEALRLGFRVARRFQTQSIAVDCLRRGAECVLTEISYTYASWAVRDCPGHWLLRGDPDTGELDWVEGQMRPEDAIWEDFLARLS